MRKLFGGLVSLVMIGYTYFVPSSNVGGTIINFYIGAVDVLLRRINYNECHYIID